MNSYAMIDGFGVYGNAVHYAMVIALVGGAFTVFLYLWQKGRLNMDEEPKFQMMQDEEIKQGEDSHGSRRKR